MKLSLPLLFILLNFNPFLSSAQVDCQTPYSQVVMTDGENDPPVQPDPKPQQGEQPKKKPAGGSSTGNN